MNTAQLAALASSLAQYVEAYTLPYNHQRMLAIHIGRTLYSFARDKVHSNGFIECIRQIYLLAEVAEKDGVEQLELEGMKTKLTLHLVVTPHGVKLENSSAMTIFGQGLAEETKVSFRIEDDAETRGE